MIIIQNSKQQANASDEETLDALAALIFENMKKEFNNNQIIQK